MLFCMNAVFFVQHMRCVRFFLFWLLCYLACAMFVLFVYCVSLICFCVLGVLYCWLCVFLFSFMCATWFFFLFCCVLLACRHDFVFCFHACITRFGKKHLSIKALILKPSVANIALSCKLSKNNAHLKP